MGRTRGGLTKQHLSTGGRAPGGWFAHAETVIFGVRLPSLNARCLGALLGGARFFSFVGGRGAAFAAPPSRPGNTVVRIVSSMAVWGAVCTGWGEFVALGRHLSFLEETGKS